MCESAVEASLVWGVELRTGVKKDVNGVQTLLRVCVEPREVTEPL